MKTPEQSSNVKEGESLEVKFLIAQYQGLQQEVASRTNAILQINAFTLLAFGTILTVAYSEHGRKDLMLLYPFVAFFASIIYIINKFVIYDIGHYIRLNMEEKILMPVEGSKWWETWIISGLRKYKSARPIAALFFFIGTQIIALFAWQPFSLSHFLNGFFLGSLVITFLTLLLLLCCDSWQELFPTQKKPSVQQGCPTERERHP